MEPPKEVGITKLEESSSQEMFSSQNDFIPVETRREIAKVSGCIRALVEAGKRVDEETVVKTYETCLDLEEDAMDTEDGYLGGEKGIRVVEAAMRIR